MNDKDYEKYLIQKYQVAIAIAVIKTKPADLTYKAHIENIKNKINEPAMDGTLNITIRDDDFDTTDSTICDDQMNNDDETMMLDDLNRSHDSVNILNNFDLADLDNTREENDDLLDVMTQFSNIEKHPKNNILQSTNDNGSQISNKVVNNKNNKIALNKTNDREKNKLIKHGTRNNVTELTKNVSNIENPATSVNNHVTDMTYYETCADKERTDIKINKENNIVDTQQTILYTLHGFTNNTHVSQSQENVVSIANKNLINRSKTSVYINLSNEIVKENSQHEKDLEDNNLYPNLNDETQNMFTDQDFEELIFENENLTGKQIQNENKTNEIHDSQACDDYGINKLERNGKIRENNCERKHKNVERDVHNTNKRAKLDSNENNSKYCSPDLHFMSANNANYLNYDNTTIKAAEMNFYKSTNQNLAVCAHNNKKKCNIDTAKTFDEKDSINPEFSFLCSPDIIQSGQNWNIDEDVINVHINFPQESQISSSPKESQIPFSPQESQIPFSLQESQNLFLSNPYSNSLLKDTTNSTAQTHVEIKKDFNQKANHIATDRNDQNFDIFDENSMNFDETFFNLSQNVGRVTTSTTNQSALNSKKQKLLFNENGIENTQTKQITETKESQLNKSVGKKNNININVTNKNSLNYDEPINLSQNFRTLENSTVKHVLENKIKESSLDKNSKKKFYQKDYSMNFDEPIINLSQNVTRAANYKTKENVFGTNMKDSSLNKMHILRNLTNDETKEVVYNQHHTKECTNKMTLTQNYMSDNEDVQLEKIPFKVVEDLNRIKCYLNRGDRRISQASLSFDSGFRSSQARSSYKNASQHSDVLKNESAHCLLSFITVSQLSDSTASIADEISTVLGKLIDKLHEEEKYPNFLEELLDKVSSLLNEVYEGNNEESHALLKREDVIYRILLINKSTHILKYTIERIVVILEEILSNLNEEVIELTHTDKIENICYIFHILEIILKRFKNSECSQITVQNSQNEEKILKRSTLTEIWRKKWNLSNTEKSEDTSKKPCILTKCSEILNKIIVQTMNGYSLVSFAALQCFNLLQT